MLYFEIIEPFMSSSTKTIVPAGIYYGDYHRRAPVAIGLRAWRIWEETAAGVIYVKDRLSWDRQVDLKEFAWVKLRAKPMRDIL